MEKQQREIKPALGMNSTCLKLLIELLEIKRKLFHSSSLDIDYYVYRNDGNGLRYYKLGQCKISKMKQVQKDKSNTKPCWVLVGCANQSQASCT